jgi:hypothetical protein
MSFKLSIKESSSLSAFFKEAVQIAKAELSLLPCALSFSTHLSSISGITIHLLSKEIALIKNSNIIVATTICYVNKNIFNQIKV